jgi:hypothetical protein
MSVVLLVLVVMTSHSILDFVHEVRHNDKLVIKEELCKVLRNRRVERLLLGSSSSELLVLGILKKYYGNWESQPTYMLFRP